MNKNFPGETNAFLITVSAQTGGRASGGGSYEYLDTCTVRATANSGYTFSGWYEGSTFLSNANPLTFTVTRSRTVTAHFTRIPTYTVTVGYTGSGTVTGGGTYTSGSSCTVSAYPSSHYTFAGWYEGGTYVSGSSSYTFTVTSNRNLTAHFNAVPSYLITVGAQTGGRASGGGQYYYLDTCTVIATANEHYRFNGWYEGDTFLSDANPLTFTVTRSRTITAHFTEIPVYLITVSAQTGGRASGGGQFEYLDQCTVTATANEHYIFSGWYEGETFLSDANPLTFTVTHSTTITAHFTPIKFGLYLTCYPSDGGYTTGGGEYLEGTEVTFTAHPNEGFIFERWSDGDTNVSRTIVMDANYTFTAIFRTAIEHIDFYVSPSGSATIVDPSETPITSLDLREGDSTEVWVADNYNLDRFTVGYKFVNWNNDVSLIHRFLPLEYDSAVSHKTYTAYLEYVGYKTLTVIMSEHITDYRFDYFYEDGQYVVGYDFRMIPTNQRITKGWHIKISINEIESGYVLKHWLVNGDIVSTDNVLDYDLVGIPETFTIVPVIEEYDPEVYYTVDITCNYYPDEILGYNYVGIVEYESPTGSRYKDNIYRRKTLRVPQGTRIGIFHRDTITTDDGEKRYWITWSDLKPDNVRTQLPGRYWNSLDQDITLEMFYGRPVTITCVSNPQYGGHFQFISGASIIEGYSYTGGRDSVITINAVANPGYDFVRWSDGVTTQLRQVTLDYDITFTAIFRDNGGEKQYYYIRAVVDPTDGGYVRGVGRYQIGSVVELEAIPNPGYRFVRWNVGTTTPKGTVTVLSDIKVVVFFEGYSPGPAPPIAYLDAILGRQKPKRKLTIIKK